jgi:hypothetical protein
MQLVAALQALAMKRKDDLHPMRLRLGAEEDDGASAREGPGAERDEERLARTFARAEASFDRFAGFVASDSED